MLSALAACVGLALGVAAADNKTHPAGTRANDNAHESTYQRRSEDSTLILNATVLDGHGQRFENADLVLWSGDPFEPTTTTVHVFVNGAEVSYRTRQDRLRDRYNPTLR